MNSEYYQEIEKYFEFAKKITFDASKILKNAVDCEKMVENKSSTYRDLVTKQDKEIENILISKLAEEFPNHKFIAEESSDPNKPLELTDAPTWIIDPIDGTTNFVHGFPQYCISIGFAINKQVEIAIISNPMNDEFYTAKRGCGAFLNGKRIKASSITELKTSLIIIEPATFQMSMKNRDISLARYETLILSSEGVRSVGSAVLAMAYVAKGIIDAFHMDYLKPWDVAAGYLIVEEAGGTVINTKGGPFNIMEPMTIAAGTKSLAKDISKLIIDTDLQTQRKRLKRT
ncbi:hypothetical protein PV326_000213 [Microctonus aethiopoides]|nr:hypothetical protein PV326_000213 [Microctonus aethiopoides]